MPPYYCNVRFSRRRSINTGHERIWYIALWLDISGADLNGERSGSVSPLSPHHLHHHTGGNADSAVKIMLLPPSSDNWSSALALLRPSPPCIPAPHWQVSLPSAPHPQYRKALSVLPIRAPQFQIKHPERHNYPAVISTTVFPCYEACLCMDSHAGSHTQGENNLSHLVVCSPGFFCCSSWLASIPAQNRPHRQQVFVWLSRTQEAYICDRGNWIQLPVKKTHGIKAEKESYQSEAVTAPIIWGLGNTTFCHLLSNEACIAHIA